MGKEAFLFPGQGSQKIGMGRELLEHPNSQISRVTQQTFQEATAALGGQLDIERICFENPEGMLDQTINTQPAIITVNEAYRRSLEGKNIYPEVVAGHSAGEISALIASGSLSFTQGVQLARERGAYMEQAPQGKMAAILKLPVETLRDILEKYSLSDVDIANINERLQIVIAGTSSAIHRAEEYIREEGGKYVPLKNISIASHSRLMSSAREKMNEYLPSIEIKHPHIPIIANTSADYLRSIEEIKGELADQLTNPVQWLKTMERMAQEGVESFVEVGNGTVLTKMAERTVKDLGKEITIFHAGTVLKGPQDFPLDYGITAATT